MNSSLWCNIPNRLNCMVRSRDLKMVTCEAKCLFGSGGLLSNAMPYSCWAFISQSTNSLQAFNISIDCKIEKRSRPFQCKCIVHTTISSAHFRSEGFIHLFQLSLSWYMTVKVIWKIYSSIGTDILTTSANCNHQNYRPSHIYWVLKFPNESPLLQPRSSLLFRVIFSWTILFHVKTSNVSRLFK